MSLVKSVEETFKLRKERNWDKLYVAIDLHGTIIVPGRLISLQVYPEAARGLKYLNSIDYISLILFTSTRIEMLQEFYNWCNKHDIKFDYLNENPECSSSNHDGDYTKKFYYNILLDDRAGFDYSTDWKILCDTIERLKNV